MYSITEIQEQGVKMTFIGNKSSICIKKYDRKLETDSEYN